MVYEVEVIDEAGAERALTVTALNRDAATRELHSRGFITGTIREIEPIITRRKLYVFVVTAFFAGMWMGAWFATGFVKN